VKLFDRSTSDQMAAAHHQLAGANAKIAELEALRAAKLPDAEIADVQRIDAELAIHRHAASIYLDRIAALGDRQRQEERASRKADKAAAVAEIAKRLARRDNASRLVEAKCSELRAGVAELLAADAAVFADWPMSLPPPNNFSYLSIGALAPLCKRDRRPSDFQSPVLIGPLRQLVEGAADGLAAQISQKGIDLIAMLEDLQPEEEDDEVEAVA
jgi:hypothetical protein